MSERTPEQLAAIAARDRDVFLEAGAGTGKTSVLVGRYCDAVTEDGATPESILAFTFTERAAGELRSRVRAELLRRAEAARDAGEAERGGELAGLARDSERAWISTIHGFCRRLLAVQPLAAGLDPRFRVLDEPEAARLAERAFDAALEELTVERDAAALLAAGFRVPRLRELVRSAYERLRGQGAGAPELPAALPPAPGEDGEEASPQEATDAREGYEAIRELFAAFARHYESLKAERSGLDFEDLQLRALGLLSSSPGVAEAWRGRFGHILVDEFQDTNRLQVALIRALQGPETRLFTVGDELQSIYGFRDADLEVFREQRRQAAEQPNERCEVMPLSGSFRSDPQIVAAVNAIGGTLLGGRPLTVGRLPEAGATDGGPAVELLLTHADGWGEEGTQLPTGSDSGPRHVAEARALAERLRELADRGVPRGQMVVLLRAFTHLAAFEEALERFGLAPHVVGGRGYWSHQQVEDLICLLSALANPLDDERLCGALSSAACGVSADALWLLRRIAGPGRHLWPALARHFGESGGGARDAEPVRESEPPEDGEARDGARASRYVELVTAADAARLRDFHVTLTALRDEAPLLSLEALIDRVTRDFSYDLTTLARDGGRRRMANVRKLMRLAREFEAREGRDLRAFLDYAAERATRDDPEGQAATEAEGVDGVRVMTVHAAKGLEFPLVAAADLGRDLLAGGRQPDVRVGSLDGEQGAPRIGLRLARPGRESITLGELRELADEQAAAEAQEALRLAYVAATRARERLILSGIFADSELEARENLPHRASVVARLAPALGVRGERRQTIRLRAPAPRPGLEASFGPGELSVSVCEPIHEQARELSRTVPWAEATAAQASAGEEAPPLAELREAAEGPAVRHLSYSALADYARCGYRFYAERILGLAPATPGHSPILAFGSAVHALLEWSARNRWASPGPERCAAALGREGLSPDAGQLERASRMIERWLACELRSRLEGARLHPEAPFLLPLGEAVVRGKMDLLAELPGGEIVVVDYKTDALGPASAGERMARYEIQRALYALAAGEGMARRNGAPGPRAVRTAYAFLDCDEPPLERDHDPAALAAARAELAELVAAIESGAFAVTERPHRDLCLDCPAQERLCSHPPERTLARTP